ncbi:MAG: hypothetical protein A2X56_01775 [Nitrospirae bacterium GWC2_57_13]|nr:MAG: hypothetical protein A2X56_01775 [Nitrospirae bacterium GWC2_57_13]OGW43367.1 MAG: hypothetical protein A2X57_03610 [Nitrospirae bacterium GWD2_57_8]HAS54693.1 hypothetical protein [Nitrospiraceae bacterium]
MQKSDMTGRAAAGFIDFLIVLALSRLPDVVGFLAAVGYILLRDALLAGQSPGKKLVGLRVVKSEALQEPAAYRESIIRNITFAAAYILFLIPYFGWILGPVALLAEILVAVGDDKGLRLGDMLARTQIIPAAPASQQPSAETPEEKRDDQREG